MKSKRGIKVSNMSEEEKLDLLLRKLDEISYKISMIEAKTEHIWNFVRFNSKIEKLVDDGSLDKELLKNDDQLKAIYRIASGLDHEFIYK